MEQVWQLLLDMLARCNECGGTLKVQPLIVNGQATVRCDDCFHWYRYRVDNDQLYYDALVDQSVKLIDDSFKEVS